MRVSAGETARPRQIRKINLACLAACKTLGMLASKLCEPKRARREVRKARSAPRSYSSRHRDVCAVPFSRRARCWGSPRATGTSAALPPLDPCSRSPLRRRSADKLLGNCKLSFLGPAHLSQASISAAQTQRKRIASSRSLVHTSVWCRGQHKRTKSRRRRAHARTKLVLRL